MGDRVFICYSRKDEGFVLKLATNLKNQGVPIWLDQWDIPTGANWDRTIEKALDETNRLLLILSPSSANSDEVQCEWRVALDFKKVVVPILYQPCEIPYRLKTIQYIDFTSRSPDDEEAIGRILSALGKARPTLKKIIEKPEKTPEIHQYPHIKIIAIAVLAILVIAAVLWFPREPPPPPKGFGQCYILPSPDSNEVRIFAQDVCGSVDNNPPNPTVFTINQSRTITKIGTYHWNNGLGTQAPGTIGLQDQSGKIYGPWQASGQPGMGGVPNANWIATIQAGQDLRAGTYKVLDSDPSTWAYNSESDNSGAVSVVGLDVGSSNIG